jgi:hypothetical protein
VKPTKTVVRTVSERLSGRRPNRLRASVTAAAAGGAGGAAVYRVMRN